MVNFLQHIFHTGHQNSKWQQNDTFFVRYIGCVHIASQNLDKFRLIKEKRIAISLYKDVTLRSQKNIFVIQSCKQELLGLFFPSFIFDSKLDI